VRAEERQLPDKCIVEGSIEDESALVLALQSLLVTRKGVKPVGSRVAVTVPEEHAYIFAIHVKGTSQTEVQIEVELALSEHVPIPLEFVVYTYELVERGLVAVIAYDARVSAAYERVLDVVGLLPVACVPHIVASARASGVPVLGQSQIVVDMGRTRTSLGLVYNGSVLASATVHSGSKRLLEGLMKSGLAAEDAMVALQSKGLAADALLQPLWEEYVQQLLPYIESWRAGVCSDMVTVAPPRRISVVGGFAPIPGVVDALSHVCAMPVQVASIWERLFPIETYIPPIHERDSHRYTSAAGLLIINR
jgi:Tfp pilus assembly PilM family ATPase